MSHKEMCADWVEEHKLEDDGGWWICDSDGTPTEGPFPTEEAVDEILWKRACEESFADAPFIHEQEKET